ncbi:MAG: tetratricopeptide repeat protein [Bacteroidales bacterium]|nr:tetratricopeptide repeat protein [Bacteroidales bacterium]
MNYRKAITLLSVIIVLTNGCRVSRNVTEEVTGEQEKVVDYTLYDLMYVEGIKQKLSGNLGEALDKFEDALELNPESDAANFEISQISAMRRDYENAMKYGRRAAELDNHNPWYMLNMANIYLEKSELDSAGIWLEKAVQIDPSDENEKFRLGNLYLQTGKPEEAEKIFEEFYEKYGGNEQILALLVNAKMEAEKYEEAEEILIKELEADDKNINLEGMLAELYRKTGSSEKAKEMYERLVNEDKYSAALGFSYLDFLLENKEYKLVLEKAKEMIAAGEITREDKLGIIARLVQDSIIISEYKEGLTGLGEQIMEKGEEDALTILMMAEIYDKVGEKIKEIELLTEYIDKNEENYYIWENLLLKLNEYGGSEKLYKYAGRASTLFNTAPLPKILYAYSLIEKDMFDEAGEELRKVRILVNNQEQFLVQILAMEAEIAFREGRIKQAGGKFDEALKLEPGNAMILNNYAYYLAEEGLRLKEALGMIEKCLKIEENITYLDTYAWVLYKLERYRDAEKVMTRIFQTGKITDAELLEHFGFIKKATGACEEAVILWQSALKEDKGKIYLIEEIGKCIKKE